MSHAARTPRVTRVAARMGLVVVLASTSALGAIAPSTRAGSDAGVTPSAVLDAAVPSALAIASGPVLIQDAQAPESVHGCVQSLAKGASRPVISEELPHRGTSGWIATLKLTIRHGRGEHVLPSGFDLQRGGEAEKELRAAGFAFPEQDGGTGATRLTVLAEDKDHPEIVTTVLEIPVVLLPEKPGRSMLSLPPLPVAIARANGDLSTVCTHVHGIVVDDPISDTPDPAPRLNPPARVQREEWKEAKIAAGVVASALVLGVLFGLLFRRWKNRPRPVPPPPPPRPAWEVALERLHEVRHAGLLGLERQREFCDRVSDALREYVGATLGFDGLERTTDEITEELRRSAMIDSEKTRVLDVLRECDLVKFAKFVPEVSACTSMLDAAEAHVRRTMPRTKSTGAKRKPVRDGEPGARAETEERSTTTEVSATEPGAATSASKDAIEPVPTSSDTRTSATNDDEPAIDRPTDGSPPKPKTETDAEEDEP